MVSLRGGIFLGGRTSDCSPENLLDCLLAVSLGQGMFLGGWIGDRGPELCRLATLGLKSKA